MDSLLLLINTEREVIKRLEMERDHLTRKQHAVGCPACPELIEKLSALEEKISLHAEHLTLLRLQKMLLNEGNIQEW
jgi:hypothetical protein